MIKLGAIPLMTDEELKTFLRQQMEFGSRSSALLTRLVKESVLEKIFELNYKERHTNVLLQQWEKYNFSTKVAQVLRELQNEPRN